MKERNSGTETWTPKIEDPVTVCSRVRGGGMEEITRIPGFIAEAVDDERPDDPTPYLVITKDDTFGWCDWFGTQSDQEWIEPSEETDAHQKLREPSDRPWMS
jgi:hypothetical protein